MPFQLTPVQYTLPIIQSTNKTKATISSKPATAIDIIHHGILIPKLKAIGLGNWALKCFPSYLTERQQLVEISRVTSTTVKFTCGVPLVQYCFDSQV